MKTKHIIFLVIGIIVVGIVTGCFIMLLNKLLKTDETDGTDEIGKKTDIEDIVGDTVSLDGAKSYIYELYENESEDDFTLAFTRKANMKIVSVDENEKTATVEFYTPDIDKIMRSNLPSVESDNFDELFEKYCSDINKAIENADSDDMITQTVKCPVITDESGTKISIKGAPLLNYEDILVEVLLEILMNESEAEQ